VKLKCCDGKSECEVFSELLNIHRGTPQGGIISLFLFDISVLDLALALLVAFVICYADDSTALVSSVQFKYFISLSLMYKYTYDL
jgi:hypothetical protein